MLNERGVESALVARGITVDIGGRAVLREVDLAVAPGEVLGVFGPSGAGKSTLFRALAGDLEGARGSVHIGAHDASRLPLWRRARLGLGYVPQTPSVLLDLDVRDNLAVFANAARHARRVAPKLDLAAIVDDLGLAPRLGVRAGALSGGERRRLEIARALAGSPSVLLLDEPFSAVDPFGRRAVERALAALVEAGGAVILSDHQVGEALRLCGRAALLVGGELMLISDASAFSEHEIVRRYYIDH